MSEADNLLATLSVDYSDEAYIYVNDDRTIMVPDELKHIAVEHDHNIETVIIDCPRYWDEHDFSKMTPYVNYMRPDGYKDAYRAKNLRVSDEDDTRILFDWTISANVTQIKGNISFLVYIEDPDANPCWHSRLNQQMVIDEGLSCKEQIAMAPDSIEDLLVEYVAGARAEIDALVDDFKTEIKNKGTEVLATIPEDYAATYKLANEATRTKGDAIVLSATGDHINLIDASNDHIRGLNLYGKTTQKTTTGAQLIPYPYTDYSGVAYSDNYSSTQNGLTITIQPDRSISIYGTLEDAFTWVFCGRLVLPAGTYSVTPNLSKDVALVVYDIDAGIGYYSTFTFTKETAVRIYFLFQNTGSAIYEGAYPMLNVGDTLLDYEPYTGAVSSPSPECPQSFAAVSDETTGSILTTVHGKNLFDGQFYKLAFGSSQHTSYRLSVFQDTNYRSIVIPVDSTKTYSFSCGENIWGRLYIAFTKEYPVHGTRIKFTNETTGKESLGSYNYGTATKVENLSVPSGCKFMVVYLTNDATNYDVTSTWYQVEVGPKATDYEEPVVTGVLHYQGYLHGLPTDSGGNYTDSTGQQWICDEVDFERGVYIQRIGYKVLNGSTIWAFNQYSYDALGLYLFGTYLNNIDQNKYNTPIVCNKLSFQKWGNQTVGNANKIYSTPGYIQIYLADQSITTVEMLAEWTAANPLDVLYALNEPTETPLPADFTETFKMTHTVYPVTNIVNHSGAGMSVKYNADTRTYIDNGIKASITDVMEAIENGSY